MTTPAEVMEERGLTARALLRPRLRLRRLTTLKHLLDDLTWRGGAETLALLCAVFTVWLLTTFEATYFDITGCQTQIAVLTAMVLGLFMNAAIDVASSAGGWAFVVPLVVTQVARGIVTSTTAPTPQLRQHHRRALTWLLTSAPFCTTETLQQIVADTSRRSGHEVARHAAMAGHAQDTGDTQRTAESGSFR